MTDPLDLDLSPEYLQSLKNREVCERLLSLGDDLSRLRPIDHVATFDARKDRELFVDFILGESFEIVSLPEPDDMRTRFEITFSRNDTPNRIDQVVLPLVSKAEVWGGSYEGWNCDICDGVG